MKQKWQPRKWEVYNRVTGEVIHTNLDKSDADQKLAGIYVWYWKDCECERLQTLLMRAFPLAIRKVGKGACSANKQMVKDWTEFQRISKEFCDAWNNAPTPDEGHKATEELRYHYDSRP